MKVFDVHHDGELFEKEYSKDLLTDTGVLIFTNDKAEHIYIWKGENAPVRNRFAASRAASQIRTEKGLHYKVISIDPGDRHKEFFELIGEPLPEVEKSSVEEIAPEPVPKVIVVDVFKELVKILLADKLPIYASLNTVIEVEIFATDASLMFPEVYTALV